LFVIDASRALVVPIPTGLVRRLQPRTHSSL
jgi:hypothetical protein